MELPIPSNDVVAEAKDMVGILRTAVRNLQSEIDKYFVLQGAVHVPSWKFPSACAAELDVASVLDRYAFVGASQQHIMVARMALLELVVDRVALLSETTFRHVDAYAHPATNEHSESDCTFGEFTDSICASDGIPVGGGGGMNGLIRLCRLTRRLRDDIASLEIRLINKDDALDRRDEEIERLVALLESADDIPGSIGSSGDVVAPNGRELRDTCVASVQTQPEVEGMNDSSGIQKLPCVGCAALRSGIAGIADAIEDNDLDGRTAVLALQPGTSPFLCNKLTVQYLEAHSGRISDLVSVLRRTEDERDAARSELSSAQSACNDLQAQLQARIDAAARQVEKHASELAEMKASGRESVRRATDQHKQALHEVELQHEQALAALRDERQTMLQEAQRHAATKIADISRELMAATDAHVETEGSLRSVRLTNSKLETELAQLRQELDQANAVNAQRTDQCTRLQAEADTLRQEMADTQAEARKATERVTELEASIIAAHTTEKRLSNELATISQLHSEQGTSLASSREELAKAEADVREWQRKCAAAEARLAESEGWLDKAGEERRRLLLELNRLRGVPSDMSGHEAKKVRCVVVSVHQTHEFHHSLGSRDRCKNSVAAVPSHMVMLLLWSNSMSTSVYFPERTLHSDCLVYYGSNVAVRWCSASINVVGVRM
eukprot:m.1094623 g.1094623  ORF g.1094623 m.1094623 type:complete len:671 (+) comp24302_c0_seq34:322-2334(+)